MHLDCQFGAKSLGLKKMVKYTLNHWTDKSSFEAISKTRRLLGLTEGRVYLTLGNSPSIWVFWKKHRIILEDFEHASKHPFCRPPSLWGLLKFNQWVTSRSSNITWDAADAEFLDEQTLIVKNAKFEHQVGIEKAIGSARFWGRWIGFDCVAALVILSLFFGHFTQNEFIYLIGIIPLACMVITLPFWFFAQKSINRLVIKQNTISKS